MDDWYRVVFSADDIVAAKHLQMVGHFERFFLAAGSPEDSALFKGLDPNQATYYFSPGSARIAETHCSSFGCSVTGSGNVGDCVYRRSPAFRSLTFITRISLKIFRQKKAHLNAIASDDTRRTSPSSAPRPRALSRPALA
jgi:hypothetical protein